MPVPDYWVAPTADWSCEGDPSFAVITVPVSDGRARAQREMDHGDESSWQKGKDAFRRAHAAANASGSIKYTWKTMFGGSSEDVRLVVTLAGTWLTAPPSVCSPRGCRCTVVARIESIRGRGYVGRAEPKQGTHTPVSRGTNFTIVYSARCAGPSTRPQNEPMHMLAECRSFYTTSCAVT